MPALSVLILDLAGAQAALPAEGVAGLLPLPRLDRPPGTPSALAGFADIGGRAVPVVALSRLLGLAARDPGLYAHIVLVEDDDGAFGLLVERVTRMATIERGAVGPATDPDRLAGCIAGEFEAGGRLVALLDLARILDARERAVVVEAAEWAERRRGAFEFRP